MRVFLDANILFSASKSDGAVRLLLQLLIEAGHEFWVDGFVLGEARRNLEAKAPAGSAVLEALLPRFHQAPLRSMDPEWTSPLALPEKDRPVLAAAIQCHCQALVTGDRKHFGDFYGQTVHGVTIHSPRSLAEELLA